MSVSHRPGTSAAKAAARLRDLRWVSRHRGDRFDFLTRHTAQAGHLLRRGRAGVRTIAPALLRRITDERSLWLAWTYLAEHGGQAPGPDGLRYDEPEAAVWEELRALRAMARSWEYEPSEERVVRVSKGPGRGERSLVLQSVLDRVVQRSCVQILQPVIDPLFDPRSFGYRPGRSHLHALALAERLARCEGLWCWVTLDIRDAFGSVPLNRLLDLVKSRLPDRGLVRFLKTVLGGSKQPGLRQGGALSPLMLNLYLHHLLDSKWRELHPELPLLRYADDLLLLCPSRGPAEGAYDELKQLLLPTGMTLKESKGEAVRDLSAGQRADYLGFRVGKGEGGRLAFRLTKASWASLAESLRLAQEADNPPARALMALLGWVGARGPCYPTLKHDHAYDTVAEIANGEGFDELPGRKALRGHWQRAYARWRKLRKSVKDA